MEQGSGALKILDPDLNLDLISCRSTGQSAQNQSSGSKDGNCSTGYVSTGGAMRRAAASGGGVVCAGFIMPSVPPKVGSDAARISVSGSLVGLFEAEPRQLCGDSGHSPDRDPRASIRRGPHEGVCDDRIAMRVLVMERNRRPMPLPCTPASQLQCPRQQSRR